MHHEKKLENRDRKRSRQRTVKYPIFVQYKNKEELKLECATYYIFQIQIRRYTYVSRCMYVDYWSGKRCITD